MLSARPDLVYVVHTPEDSYFKVQMLDYHDDAGTAGYLSLRCAALGCAALRWAALGSAGAAGLTVFITVAGGEVPGLPRPRPLLTT